MLPSELDQKRPVTASLDRREIDVFFNKKFNQYIIEENKAYGKKNKPRDQDPSMQQLLSWQNQEQEIWNYKTNNKQLLVEDAAKMRYQLCKTKDVWTSETKEAYNKFTFGPDKNSIYIEIKPVENLKPQVEKQQEDQIKFSPEKAQEKIQENLTKNIQQQCTSPQSTVFKSLDNLSIYQQDFGIKNIANINELQNQIQQNCQKKELKIPKKQNFFAEYDEDDEKENKSIQKDQQNANVDGEEAEEDNEEIQAQKEKDKLLYKKPDYSQIKTRLLGYKPKVKKLDKNYEKERLDRRKQRIKHFQRTTKWMANSTFTTYYGKPPFESYGYGNTRPTIGGVVYGNYLRSHNINPHRGTNQPKYEESFKNALLYAQRYPPSEPEPPRKVQDDYRLSQKQVEELNARNPLFAEKNQQENIKIVKPDLINTVRFASNINSGKETPKNQKKLNPKEQLEQLQQASRKIREHLTQINQDPLTQMTQTKSTIPKQQPQSSKNKENMTQSFQNQKTKKDDNSKMIKQSSQVFAQQSQNQDTQFKKKNTAGVGQGEKQQQLRVTFNNVDEESEEEENPVKDTFRWGSQRNLQEVKDKKKQSKKISYKVTEVDPFQAVQQQQSGQSQQQQEQQKQQQADQMQTQLVEQQQGQDQIGEDSQLFYEIDPMHPPKGYQKSISQKELNPHYYKNVPPVWMNRIHYAGLVSDKSESVKDLLLQKKQF